MLYLKGKACSLNKRGGSEF